jgi:hypothetical protein
MTIHKFAALAALTAALVTGTTTAGAATADGGANNIVVAKTTTDSFDVAKSHTQITPSPGPDVANKNVALATATGCTGCHATSVAVQVLFVDSPRVFTPTNIATAVNSDCSGCGTFAYAWQYVIQADGPVHLSPEGRQQVDGIEQQIDDTASSIVPDTLADDLALQAKLDALTAQLQAVVDSQVRQSGTRPVVPPVVHEREEIHPASG